MIVFVVFSAKTAFTRIPLSNPAALRPARLTASAPGTMNELLTVLTDGQLAQNYGPVFGNGVTDGAYKLDLGTNQVLRQINTFSHNQNQNRGRQRFILYGSRAATDPGWDVDNPRQFTPLFEMDTRPATNNFLATSIRPAGHSTLGAYRWLVWRVAPVTPNADGENTAFQELQVLGGN